MTSNAGAQHAHQASVGFGGGVAPGQAMLAQVKRTFKPEFLNRLSATVVFNAMNAEMAQLILGKKVDALRHKLQARRVDLVLSSAAENYLLNLGYTPEYGAREIERIVARELKPLLTRSLLFGDLKHGGVAHVDVAEEKLVVTTTPLAVSTEKEDAVVNASSSETKTARVEKKSSPKSAKKADSKKVSAKSASTNKAAEKKSTTKKTTKKTSKPSDD